MPQLLAPCACTPGASREAEQTLDQHQNNPETQAAEAPLQTSGRSSATESQLSLASEFHGDVLLASHWVKDLLGKPFGS